MEVGSGAIRITPAHNAYDYEIGRRHNLPFINVLDDDGYVTEAAGEMFKVRIYRLNLFVLLNCLKKGMKRFHARMSIVQALKDAGLYIGSRDQPMKLSTCRYEHSLRRSFALFPQMASRKSGDILQVVLKSQWWLRSKSLAETATKVCLV